jgi:hypothetical protein
LALPTATSSLHESETMPKKSSAPGKTPSKTAFVLSLPSTMSAKDVLSKGRAAGLKLTEAYIYSIRSKAKGRAGKPAARRGRPPKAVAAAASGSMSSSSSGGGLERQFLNLALDLGLSRAESLLSSLRAKVKSAIA